MVWGPSPGYFGVLLFDGKTVGHLIDQLPCFAGQALAGTLGQESQVHYNAGLLSRTRRTCWCRAQPGRVHFERMPRRTFYALPSYVYTGHFNYTLALTTAAAGTIPQPPCHRRPRPRGRRRKRKSSGRGDSSQAPPPQRASDKAPLLTDAKCLGSSPLETSRRTPGPGAVLR